MISFSTRHFEINQRALAWQDALARYCGPFELKTRGDFQASMERGQIGAFACTRMVQNSLFMGRSRRELERTQPDYYYILLQIAGYARISQCGSDADMSPGQIVVIDAGRPVSMEYRGKNTHIALHVPRRLLESRHSSAPKVAVKITGPSALLIGSLMQTAVSNIGNLSPNHHQVVEESVLALLAAAFEGSTVEAFPQAATASQERSQVLVQMIREYVNQNLATADLSPRAIAKAHGMSVRHVHRLFNRGELSLAGLVRRTRLERCAEYLRDPSMQSQSVTQIAYRWGFNDSAHFSRAFKDEFGQCPREYRSAALGGSAASQAFPARVS